MGYPMTWNRLVRRNQLDGGYGVDPRDAPEMRYEPTRRDSIRGDMRRLESDSRDDFHLRTYAELAHCTPEQVKAVLDAFFGDVQPHFSEHFGFNHAMPVENPAASRPSPETDDG